MHQIDVNGLVVNVVRKDIKNLHVAVYPPAGRIRVAAPLLVDDEAVRLAVTEREYVNGESHYFQGARYRLNIVVHDAPGKVVVRNKRYIDLYARPGSDKVQRGRVMSAWYRAYLRQAVPPLIEKWEKIIGVHVADWGIKEMKTRWGSCNIEAGRIWVNLELAKKSGKCLEYIVVHEMMHLLERHHDEQFLKLMNKFMPQWREYRDLLNRAPLAHAEWEY
jgi:predicted metal-dependent hydrolase